MTLPPQKTGKFVMRSVSRAEMLFAVKIYIAGMLAYYIASRFLLPQPSSALLSVFLVMNPLSGTGRSKAFIRFVGTLFGVTVGILAAVMLSNVPEFLLAFLGLFFAACSYLSLTTHPAKSFTFIISGITSIIVVAPNIGNPNAIVDAGVNRFIEIAVGIACALVVDSVLFPKQVTPLAINRVDGWLNDMRSWLIACIGRKGTFVPIALKMKLASETADIDHLFALAAFDSTTSANVGHRLEAIHRHMLSAFPLMHSVGSELAEEKLELSPRLATLLTRLEDALVNITSSQPLDLSGFIEILADHENQLLDNSAIIPLTELRVTESLKELLSDIQRVSNHRLYIDHHNSEIPEGYRNIPNDRSKIKRHVDRPIAALTAFVAFFSFAAAVSVWAYSGTAQGSFIVIMAVVSGGFFGVLDSPASAGIMQAKLLLPVFTLISIFMYIIYPNIQNIEILAIAFAAIFMPLGILLMRRPTWILPIILTMLNVNFSPSYTPQDFTVLVETGVCCAIGLIIGIVVNLLIRSFTADFMARRIVRAGWREIAYFTRSAAQHDSLSFTAVMLRRLALILPRYASLSPEEAREVHVFREIKIGLSIALIKKEKIHSTSESSIDVLLDHLRDFFDTRDFGSSRADARIISQIDQIIKEQSLTQRRPRLLVSLLELKGNLQGTDSFPLAQ